MPTSCGNTWKDLNREFNEEYVNESQRTHKLCIQIQHELHVKRFKKVRMLFVLAEICATRHNRTADH